MVFKITLKCADQKAHAESKHDGKTLEECFPGIGAQIKALEEDASGKGKGPGGMAAKAGDPGSKKKKDDSASLLMEGLGATKPKKTVKAKPDPEKAQSFMEKAGP